MMAGNLRRLNTIQIFNQDMETIKSLDWSTLIAFMALTVTLLGAGAKIILFMIDAKIKNYESYIRLNSSEIDNLRNDIAEQDKKHEGFKQEHEEFKKELKQILSDFKNDLNEIIDLKIKAYRP